MKLLRLSALLATTLFTGALLSLPSHAVELDELKACKALTIDTERLACYDALTNEAVVEAETPKEENFGFEKEVKVKASPDTIVTTIDGEFTGWTGKTKFKLANGQVWQQVDRKKFRHSASNPEAIIEKGFLGSFYMRVDGLGRRVKVKRIK